MGKYDDIIRLPHHESRVHEKMLMKGRAAQFAPFAALNGHEELIKETARTTGMKRELSADEKEILSRKLQQALEHRGEPYLLTITFFVVDADKVGGETFSVKGRVAGIDMFKRKLRLDSGFQIPLDDILQINLE